MATLPGLSTGVTLASGDFLQDFQNALNEVQTRFPHLKEDIKQTLALEMARKQSITQAKTISVREFSKYAGEEAPQTFLKKFEDESNMMGLTTNQKLTLFPSLMTGKASPAAPILQQVSNWQDMENAFEDYFRVDRHVVLTELQALRCDKLDVVKYVTQFNQIKSKYYFTVADDETLKDAFVSGLPFKCKEALTVHRDMATYTLQKLQGEAQRTQAQLTILYPDTWRNRENREGWNNRDNKDGRDKRDGDRVGFKDRSGDRRAAAAAAQEPVDHSIFHAYLVHESKEDQYGHVATLSNESLVQHVEHAVATNDSFVQYSMMDALTDHLHRQLQQKSDAVTQTRGGRLRAKELFSEAERILAKTGSGMSLLERVARDELLRNDLIALLTELGAKTDNPQLMPVAPTRGAKAKRPTFESHTAAEGEPSGDASMRDVPLVFQKVTTEEVGGQVMQVRQARPVKERWNDQQRDALRRYYGCPPTLIEGIENFMNSEKQKCFENTTAHESVTTAIPIANNSPYINVLVDGRYKLRGILDTGSTNTIMSSGLFNLLKGLTLAPTSTGFRGVGAGAQYEGIIDGLTLQFSDKLKVTLNVGVVPSDERFLLIGSECIGGEFAKLTRLAQSDPHSFIVLQDDKGTQDLIWFIRNRERNELHISKRVEGAAAIPPKAPNELQQLFRT